MKTLLLNAFIEGVPAPGGSKKYVGHSKKTGRAVLIDAGGKRNKCWRKTVVERAKALMGQRLSTGLPIICEFTFIMPRPKCHFRKNGTLKDSAPRHHLQTPDALKLARSTEDALTGIVWADDKTSVKLVIEKRWASFTANGLNEASGCWVTIHERG